MYHELNNDDLKNELARLGKVLTASERDRIASAQHQAAAHINSEYDGSLPESDDLSAVDRQLVRVPGVVKLINDIGDTVLTVARALIVFGVPVILAFVLVVEVQRVMHGVEMFEVDAGLAALGAWVLVLSNLALELIVYYVNERAGYRPERRRRRSLVLMWRRFKYFAGLQSDWQPVEHSPAHRWESLTGLLTWAILALALLGSMKGVMAQLDGMTWYEGLLSIVRDSNLVLMTTWAGGLLFALVVVKVAQALTAYVAQRAAEFAVELETRAALATADNPAVQEHEQRRAAELAEAAVDIERQFLLAKLYKHAEKQATPDPLPASTNGHYETT